MYFFTYFDYPTATRYLCVKVSPDNGMRASWDDGFDGNDAACYDVMQGAIQLDCGRGTYHYLVINKCT